MIFDFGPESKVPQKILYQMLVSLRKRSAAVKDNNVEVAPLLKRSNSGFVWNKKQGIWRAFCPIRIPERPFLLPKTRSDLQSMMGTSKWQRYGKNLFIAFLICLVCVKVACQFLHGLDGGTTGGSKQSIRLAATRFWVLLEQWGAYKPLRDFDLNYAETYPELKVLQDNYLTIRKEAEDLSKILDQLVPISDVIDGVRLSILGKCYS